MDIGSSSSNTRQTVPAPHALRMHDIAYLREWSETTAFQRYSTPFEDAL